jgi:CRP-like cAMP-binding protein
MVPRANITICSTFAGPCRHKPANNRCLSCILDDSSYFATLPMNAKLALQAGMQMKTFPRLTVLYHEGGHDNNLYILISGEVKVYKSTADGRQQIHKIASIPGDLIACEDLFLSASSSTSVAISDTTVCMMRRDFLREATAQFPQISDAMMQAMARNLNAYIRHIANLGSKNAESKVASYLVFQHETHKRREDHLNFLADSLTRVEMAEMLGMTQRTLIRSLKTLTIKRAISIAKDGFMILDMNALSRLAEGTE